MESVEVVDFLDYARIHPKGGKADYVRLRHVLTIKGYEDYGKDNLFIPLPYGYFSTRSTAHVWAED